LRDRYQKRYVGAHLRVGNIILTLMPHGITATRQSAIQPEQIASTYQVIRSYIRRTPLIEVDAADFGLSDFRIIFKLESLQHSGSFKARGAFASMLLRKVPPAGVVAASGGNHGAAV